MKNVDALEQHESVGDALDTLARLGEPVVVRRAGEPVAVLISVSDFRERFLGEIPQLQVVPPRPEPQPEVQNGNGKGSQMHGEAAALEVLREFRALGGLDEEE